MSPNLRKHCRLLPAVSLALFWPAAAQDSPEKILLKDYRPKSLYKIPATQVPKAKFRVIDMHSHPYASTPEQIAEWVKNMDEVGVEKTVVLTGAVGTKFDEIYER